VSGVWRSSLPSPSWARCSCHCSFPKNVRGLALRSPSARRRRHRWQAEPSLSTGASHRCQAFGTGAFVIEGTVTDERGAGIAGATLYCAAPGAHWSPRASTPGTESSNSGSFRFECPGPGPFDLVCRHRDYRSSSVTDLELRRGVPKVVSLTMPSGAPLFGSVRTPVGDPVPDAWVVVRGRGGNRVSKLSQSLPGASVELRSVRTGPDGEFEVRGLLETRRYIVHAMARGMSARTAGGTRDTVCVIPHERADLVLSPAAVVLAKPVDEQTGDDVRAVRWTTVRHVGGVEASIQRTYSSFWLGSQLVRPKYSHLGGWHVYTRHLGCWFRRTASSTHLQ